MSSRVAPRSVRSWTWSSRIRHRAAAKRGSTRCSCAPRRMLRRQAHVDSSKEIGLRSSSPTAGTISPRITRSNEQMVEALQGQACKLQVERLDGFGHFDTALALGDPKSAMGAAPRLLASTQPAGDARSLRNRRGFIRPTAYSTPARGNRADSLPERSAVHHRARPRASVMRCIGSVMRSRTRPARGPWRLKNAIGTIATASRWGRTSSSVAKDSHSIAIGG